MYQGSEHQLICELCASCMHVCCRLLTKGQTLGQGLAPASSAGRPYATHTHTHMINCVTHTRTMWVRCTVSILLLVWVPRRWRTKVRSVPLIYAMFFPWLSLRGAAGLHNSNNSYSHSVLFKNIPWSLAGQPGSIRTSGPKPSCIIPESAYILASLQKPQDVILLQRTNTSETPHT